MVAAVNKSMTATVTFGYKGTAGDLLDFLKDVPNDAKLNVSVYKGDQRDPYEVTIKATWSV